MQTLVPQAVTQQARPWSANRRLPARLLGWSLTPRALALLFAGLLFVVLAFLHIRFVWLVLAWDVTILLLVAWDLLRIPSPRTVTVTRRFLEAAALGEPTEIEIELHHENPHRVHITVTDALHPSLAPQPFQSTMLVWPRDPATLRYSVTPRVRGDLTLEPLYLRTQGTLGLAERWAIADPLSSIRVYPASVRTPQNSLLYLIRARQLALQKRRLRLRGLGREFESLRDYQQGDSIRDVSWTATARRGKPITRQFTTERSQQVWILLDAGRLSQSTFTIHRNASGEREKQPHESFAVEHDPSLRAVTQMDLATSTALLLAQVVSGAGDKVAMLAYGRRIRQTLLPGAGASHLRLFTDLLAQVHSEPSEANHLMAGARLRSLQRRRGLVVWMTDLADGANAPEIAAAAADLSRQHLVVVVLLRHPELAQLAEAPTETMGAMYATAAAREMLERRRATIAGLESNGILVLETTADAMAADTVTRYLEVKAESRI